VAPREESGLIHLGREYRVIIADDDDQIRESLCEVVSRLRVVVEGASSGCDLGILLAAKQPADLLITDVRMPWLTGLQVATAARNAGLQIPIIVMTAFPDDEIRSKVDGLGSAVLLTKPFDDETLVALVREQLADSAPR